MYNTIFGVRYEGSISLQNYDIYLQVHMVSQPRIPVSNISNANNSFSIFSVKNMIQQRHYAKF